MKRQTLRLLAALSPDGERCSSHARRNRGQKKWKVSMMKLLVGLATILTFAQSAFAGNTAAITYTDAASVQQIRVFARGFNQHLVVDAWDGRWQWYDLGNPLTYYSMSPDLSAITYMDAAGTQQIRVFGTVNDYSFGPYHSLIVANWDGTGWTWSDLGLPPGVSSFRRGDKLNAIEYVDDFGNQQIRVFATGDNSHLIVAAWDGSWNWYDLGVPPGTPGVYNPDAIVYTDAGEPQHLRVFVNGSDGQLYTDAWDGTSWQWFNLGSPAPTYFTPVAITYRDDESRQIRVFAGGSDGHVYTAAWDGSWSWYDLGFPPSGFRHGLVL